MSFSRQDSNQNWVPEATEGNGNCLFNAIVLQLSRPEVLDYIGQNLEHADRDYFIEQAARELETAQEWDAIQRKWRESVAQNKTQFQVLLAPLMRAISDRSARNNPQHVEQTIPALRAAFNDYVRSRVLGIEIGPVQDDIYRQHPFILAEFARLADQIPTALYSGEHGLPFDSGRYNELSLRSQSTALSAQDSDALNALEVHLDAAITPMTNHLIQWWTQKPAGPASQSGHDQFLSAMAEDKKWGGDLEAKEVGRFFKVNVEATTGGGATHMIHQHSATAPTLKMSNPNAIHWSSLVIAPAPAPRVESTLMAETRNLITSKAMKPNQNKWAELIAKADAEDQQFKSDANFVRTNPSVEYQLDNGVKQVTVKTQIELDEELAKRLQAEETKAVNQQIQDDATLARKLQNQENKTTRPRR